MDDGWWDAFGLAAWRASYRKHPACRASVDRLLIERRGWPDATRPGDCAPAMSDAAHAMLRSVANLRRMAIAYGLRSFGCPDYLLLGNYRRALSPWLDAWQCDRLLLTRQDWPEIRALSPDAIVSAALAHTGECLDAAQPTGSVSDDGVATVRVAARLLLPPPPRTSSTLMDSPVADDIWPRLAALERMLCMSSTTH
ncbi:type III secretion system domain-containing protein [Pandoraea faecigallinarum]|nr:type III secretion system domain-containing protein [Pandoraea faecigallinarum]